MNNIKWEDAPEWADKLMHTPVNIDYWCNDSKFKEVADVTNYGRFGVSTGLMLSDMCLIEMRPDQQEDNAEWVPTFGDECLVNYTYEYGHMKVFHGLEALIIGVCNDTNGDEVFTASTGSGFVSLKANGFLPLKTDEQKAKEAFIGSVRKELYKIGEILDFGGDKNLKENSIAKVLFDAGFTAPEGGE
tara:strand:- start:37 stop:600 length:564 start_codon:yes stop_codon:yes gene_type:complete